MCGIAGIFASDPKKNISESLLSNMIHTILHRGPDAQQTWVTPGVGFAHSRLSIIDLSSPANQPMIDPQTGNVIVFNGEIYNYIELKNELTALGNTFLTKSDTEVILIAYRQWGVECLNKFNGMWAFALYDQREKVLFCSRDRMGIKPFVYGISKDNDIVFASEAKAITHHLPEFKNVNHDFLLNFVEHDFFACYQDTFYKNMFNLMPGHYFIAKPGDTPHQKRYWNWTPKLSEQVQTDTQAQSHFSDLLEDSIKLRFRSDVPVGSCLSGGLDSGTIVGLASKLFDKRIHTFSCVFPNSPAFDESAYIRASANKFNTIPYFVEPSHDDFLQLIRSSVYEQDGPTGGPSVLSQRAVMELAGSQVKVVLDGQGADELLGGYHAYFYYSLLSHASGFKQNKSLRNLYAYFQNASKINQRTGLKIGGITHFLKGLKVPAQFYSKNAQESQLKYFSEYDNDHLNTLLLEHVFTNLTNLLHYEDRNSMRFSVESRLPFLDYRLIEYAFTLSHHYKIRGSTTKWLLSNVAKNVLPTEVLNRKDKMGFTTPAHEWILQKENMSYFGGLLNAKNHIFTNLSPTLQSHLKSSFNRLANDKTPSTASGVDINGLWRFFTANMWHESL